jgi:hypothetical protein
VSDLPPILPYESPGASPSRPGARGLGITIFLGVLQFFWVFGFSINEMDWDGPKHFAADSLYYFLSAIPSIAGLITGFYFSHYHLRKTGRDGVSAVCFLVSVISGAVVGFHIYGWIVDILLDPHGRWYPA